MEEKRLNWLHVATFLQLAFLCYGCQIDGVSNWLIPVDQQVIDTHIGTFFNRTTSNIQGINNIAYRDGLNRGPYLDVTLIDSQFIVGTNDAFEEYEEYETTSTMGVTVAFSCVGGTTSVLVMVIDIIDTNNNAPRFLPTNSYEFSVIPPLPPGFMVTGCEHQIRVRDIDLTTQRIDFTIEDNPYFEITYDTTSSIPKEFNAVLRAKTFIRTISESLNFTITATDVDETNDPPLTETAIIRISSDDQFQWPDELVFSRAFYIIQYTSEHLLVSDEIIYLSQGYDNEVIFTFDGDFSTFFDIRVNGNDITFEVKTPLTSEVLRQNQIYLVLRGEREYTTGTSATIIIKFTDTVIEPDVIFDKVLYKGHLENNVVTHEDITIYQYSGDIIVSGDYGEFFSASTSNGSVSVETTATILTTDLHYIALKLIAASASAVLLLDIIETSTPVPPSLSFSSPSYIVRTDEAHTGLLGQVAAAADNGETVEYSLKMEDAHLGERLSISDFGEIRTSVPVEIGVHTFSVVATTVLTRVSATAIVHLIVEASTVSEDTISLPPLLIIERYEEEPHLNLVAFEHDKYPNCQYQITNRWPIDQTWLYVDESGLHTQSIDREHESIAFMHVSQVQVELNVNCDAERSKRSLGTDVGQNGSRSNDFGTNNWILTDSIPYNPKRSLVNLIVLDINDNSPIFVGKNDEPLTVGYPEENIAEVVLPRALAELKATDADIGENAELLYWSSENNVAVSPTGSVHVRNHAILEDNARFIVHATDRNGIGLTGSIELLVKLLNKNNIAVITVRNAFVDDEPEILDDLALAVGYEIKTLRTTVVSERIEEANNNGFGYKTRETRKRRQVDTTGASLMLYIYGLKDREPIDVAQLTRDLNNNVVTVSLAQVLSLEDHLEGLQICPIHEREIGLLVATIALAALLFILVMTIAVWFYLKCKKRPTYDQFSDQNSLASRNEPFEAVKTDAVIVPGINIDELKKSENNLQELLDNPKDDFNQVIVEETENESTSPKTVSYELPNDTIVNISTTDPTAPIVIQSIDKLKDNADESEDDDEFGERQRQRRKSVVTFNENVEKIIHLEDRTDDESEPDMEVYEF